MRGSGAHRCFCARQGDATAFKRGRSIWSQSLGPMYPLDGSRGATATVLDPCESSLREFVSDCTPVHSRVIGTALSTISRCRANARRRATVGSGGLSSSIANCSSASRERRTNRARRVGSVRRLARRSWRNHKLSRNSEAADCRMATSCRTPAKGDPPPGREIGLQGSRDAHP